MKKNGFTLVEITVCVVLLVTIFLIVVPKVNTMIKQKKQDSYNSLISTIKDAAQAYVYLNVNIVDDAIESQGYYEVSIRTLQENELLENKLENPLTGKNIPSTSIVKIIKNNEEYIYKFSLDYQYLLEHIIDLYSSEETRTSNGLKKDNTPDQNIRYYGSDPNNYVRFNNELWRIIGVFGNNVKLVRKDNLGWLSWDSSDSAINNGYGINQWGESTYEDGTTYEGSDLMQYLNKMYYGGDTTVICYGGPNNATKVCPKDSKGNFLIINETSKELIDYYTWNTGAIEYKTRTDTLAFYQDERETKTGKNCTSNDNCNDNIIRTTEWTGYIGLPYVTDWAYASGESICEVNMIKEDNREYICNRNNWMRKVDWFWTISPGLNNKDSNIVWGLFSYANVTGRFANYVQIVFPAIYLKSNVIIESGNGSESNPYMLKLNS